MPELDFKGKEFVRNHHLTVPYRPLVPVPEKGIGEPDLNGNLIIHGDNLEALKALLPLYAGKVDCIFIDPPYNTGNEGWSYNDNVNSPVIKAWFSENPVGIDDGLRHDKWCCMMWPRLELLSQLISPNGGVLAITIDDNEVAALVQLCNEIFGSEAFVALLPVVNNLKGNQDKAGFAATHEYLLILTTDKLKCKIKGVPVSEDDVIAAWLSDEYGLYKQGAALKATGQNAPRYLRPNLWYPLYVSTVGTVRTERDELHSLEVWPITDGQEMSWRWEKAKAEREYYNLLANGSTVYKKQRPAPGEGPTTKPKSIFYKPEYSTGNGTAEIKQILGGRVFSYPKPLSLIRDVLYLLTDDGATILDSFAGSGTTAHATLQLGGNRRFILVEMEDYADSITAERVRRVVGGYSFGGSLRESLYEKRVTWTELRKAEALRQEAVDVKAMRGAEYDEVQIKVDDGVLKVIGLRHVVEHVEGLGGEFTYCELGAPFELQALLSGNGLPERDALADYLLYIAGFERSRLKRLTVPEEVEGHYLGSTDGLHMWLMYRPDRKYLSSADSALTLEVAKAIHRCKLGGTHRVYSPAKYVGTKTLREEGVEIEHVPLPLAIFRGNAG